MSGLQVPATPMFGTSAASGPSSPILPDQSRNRQWIDTNVPKTTTDSSRGHPAINASERMGGTQANNSQAANRSSDHTSSDEQLSLNSLPARPKSDLADSFEDKIGKNEEDSSKDRPFSSGSDHRSNSVIRIPSTKSPTSRKNRKDPRETDMPN
jgi:hypothetical protein